MTKREFELVLYRINGVPVECRLHQEKGKRLYLYYSRMTDTHGIHEHLGTWQGRKCWIFDGPVSRLLKDNPEFVKREDAR
jgi:hypothetical protein